MNRKTIGTAAALLVMAAVFGIVGNMDFKDEIREQLAYCDNVRLKVWPDYNKTYNAECTPEKLKRYEELLR